MAYYENSGQVNDEAISVAGGRTFQVIQLADAEGNIIDPAQGSVVFDGEVTIESEVEIKNDSGNPVPVNGTVNVLTGLEIPEHDYISLAYSGTNLTGVVYKRGGSGGTTVATLALTYDGSGNLTSVTKS
jgi:hypothetical protein